VGYNEGSAFGFEDLDVYQAARRLRNRFYKLAQQLPGEERFALASQMRRAAVSLTNNIAEGHGRFHWQDNSRFCRQARGSLCELVDDVSVCMDMRYASPEALDDLKTDAADVLRLLNGYIRYLQNRRRGRQDAADGRTAKP
jgi:four helix bundle protein